MRRMIETGPAVNLTFIVYLLVVLAIGIVAWRSTANLRDYILGGRRLGRWTTALSAQASDMSGWLLLGLPGYAYVAGLESMWLVLGLLAGTWLNWRFTARRLRQATEAYGDALTVPEYLQRRFADPHGLLRLLGAAVVLLFFTFYTASGLVAGGKLFEAVFGLPYTWAVAAGAGAVLTYTFIGGFLAVSWTDALQGMLMLVALVLVACFGVAAAGGFEGLAAGLAERNPALLSAFTDTAGAPLTLIAVVSLLGWGLGYFGQPHILARFMAVRSADELVASRRIAVGWVIIALGAALVVGLTGAAWLSPALEGADTEKVFMAMAAALLHPVVAGICLAGILAAVMSTADSQLLVASSAVSEDLYRDLLRPTAAPGELLWIGRLAVIVIAIGAFVLALDPESKVLDLVAYAWAGFGASFGPTLLASLYWRRMSLAGAYAGILAGGITVVTWKSLSGGIFDLYEIVPGVLFSAMAVAIFGRIGPPVPLPESLRSR
ncbi:sodium/proline symporter PutP [Thioalkalivibrio sp. XN8]|uniref:sodium/proline symporter PutP n=1 Tax=Thioalkalivibrio sp. XN8 TaxID=2712863 RepID=UPI001F10BA23|nr:sodium/proline symporter PutP [Thioalkalivibrio sp. XN8]